MQFAYLDDASFGAGLIGSLLTELRDIRTPEQTEELPEVELPDEWKEFRTTLFNFQQEHAKTRREYVQTKGDLSGVMAKLNTLNNMASTLSDSTDLKEKVSSIITQFESDNKVQELTARVTELRAVIEEQRKVLEHTNAEQQVKYQCFVCMERPVDICLDPCGHVMCVPCWNRCPQTDRKCPGCRAATKKTIKIFTL